MDWATREDRCRWYMIIRDVTTFGSDSGGETGGARRSGQAVNDLEEFIARSFDLLLRGRGNAQQ